MGQKQLCGAAFTIALFCGMLAPHTAQQRKRRAGDDALAYLRRKDKRLCEVIDRIGHIDRAVDTDLFSSVVHHIVSTKAQATIGEKELAYLRLPTAGHIDRIGGSLVSSVVQRRNHSGGGRPPFWLAAGSGHKSSKAEYITDLAEKVRTGAFDLDAVAHMSDEDAIRALSSLKGIGVWTAEMILLFCLQRPDVFSYDDLAIQRGLLHGLSPPPHRPQAV